MRVCPSVTRVSRPMLSVAVAAAPIRFGNGCFMEESAWSIGSTLSPASFWTHAIFGIPRMAAPIDYSSARGFDLFSNSFLNYCGEDRPPAIDLNIQTDLPIEHHTRRHGDAFFRNRRSSKERSTRPLLSAVDLVSLN